MIFHIFLQRSNQNSLSMKRTLFVVLVFALCATSTFGQTLSDTKPHTVGLRVDFLSTAPSGYQRAIPLLSVDAEFGVVNNLINGRGSICAGGYFAFADFKKTFVDGSSMSQMYRVAGARALFRFRLAHWVEFYGGLMAGCNFIQEQTTVLSATTTKQRPEFVWAGVAGARLFPTKRFGFVLEVSEGFFSLNTGVAYRF